MSIAIYKRVSTDKQTTASQDADLTHWAANQTAPIKTYADTFTGKTMNRPGMSRLMADIRAGKVKTLVVWRMDRLGRTVSGLSAMFDELTRLGVNFVSMKDGIDLSTPAGRLVAGVLASVAQYETEIRAERVKAGIEAAKETARREGRKRKVGGRPPGSNHKRTAELDQTVKTMAASGEPIAKIARVLKLSRPTVYKILNPQE